PTLALDKKLESHSACSPAAKGGISAGGLGGSKVRFAKVTGCLSIVAGGVSFACWWDERYHHPSQTKMSPPRVTQSRIERREDITASAFDFPNKTAVTP